MIQQPYKLTVNLTLISLSLFSALSTPGVAQEQASNHERPGTETLDQLQSQMLDPVIDSERDRSEGPRYIVTVNSPKDGPINPDNYFTLREAIELVNGHLDWTELSPVEQQQAQTVNRATQNSEILFALPTDATTIALETALPDIIEPGLVIDGSSQTGYGQSTVMAEDIEISTPIITLTPAPNQLILRGLTLVADNITVRGLSIHGFSSLGTATETTPPADIFIAHYLPPPIIREQWVPAVGFSFYDENIAPRGIVLEENWLGITKDGAMPEAPSAFGISVFNSQGVTIRNNRISYHDGSGIITGARAENMNVYDNLILANGLAGMPDGIRLEGRIHNGRIHNNLICGSDGSGIFMFKPEGAVEISHNHIRANGQRFRRAAVYVMGTDHQILDNVIAHQKGPGVVVTSFSQGGNTHSQRNIIFNNFFDQLEGLSIDLNTRKHTEISDFQRGDGPNPPRNSFNRRRETGNSAINAPQFLSTEFFFLSGEVTIQGVADQNAEVQLYLSRGQSGDYGPLTQPLATVRVDESGHFSYVSTELQPGDVISATATDPTYGTSEPAFNAVLQTIEGSREAPIAPTALPTQSATCLPVVVTPEPPPEPIRLEIPRNIHFGLDEDFISPASAQVLEQMVAILKAHPSIMIDLYGHTDSRASNAYNQDLARRRAENTRRYLIAQGITPERMTLRSLGESALRVEEIDRTNYARNRRVEFIFRSEQDIDIIAVDQEEDLQIEPN